MQKITPIHQCGEVSNNFDFLKLNFLYFIIRDILIRTANMFYLVCICLLLSSTGFHVHIRGVNRRSIKLSMELQSESELAEDFQKKLKGSDYSGAYQLLKKNPMLNVGVTDAKVFLNNVNNLIPNSNDPDEDQRKTIEAAAFIYKRLERQKVLSGYNCVTKETYPEDARDISPPRLEELTGKSMTALTPQERTNYWRLAGIGLCLGEK